MLKASGNKRIVIIRPNNPTPQIRWARGPASNRTPSSRSRTRFSRRTRSGRRSRRCVRRTPATLRRTTPLCETASPRQVARSLQLAEAKISRVVTVHDGYGTCSRSGSRSRRGAAGTWSHAVCHELRDMVRLLQREKIQVVFSGQTFRAAAQGARRQGRCKVYIISHIASGPFRRNASSARCRPTSRP